MSLELIQQGPSVYVPILLLSLAITLALYSAFPLIFAATRTATSEITTTKYRVICYAVNMVIAILLTVIAGGGAINFAPCVLWTAVFSGIGIRIMEEKGVFGYVPDSSEVAEETEDPLEIGANTGVANDTGWQCVCGKINPRYMSSCSCGKSKIEAMHLTNSAAGQKSDEN